MSVDVLDDDDSVVDDETNGDCEPAHRLPDEMRTSDGVFWPIPITLSTDGATADSIAVGEDVVGDKHLWMKENTDATLVFHKGRVIAAEVPLLSSTVMGSSAGK